MHRLRQFTFWTLFFWVFALSGQGQSRLNFPRVLSAQELSTTGFAFVNTSSSAVVATFSFYGNDGVLAGQSTLSFPAKGQVAKLASEISSTVKTSVWVQVSSPSAELQGFELVGDFATLVDGAGPATEATQLGVIDFSKEDIIHIVNPGSQPATVQLTLNAANGSTLTTRSITLAAFQPMSFRLGDLNDDDNIDLVSLSANVAISASLTTKLPGGADIGLTNATPTANAPTELLFPFAPTGPQGGSNWKTLLGIANVGTSSQTVSITFNPDGGAPVTIQRNLSSKASVGDTVANLFSSPSNTFTAGWIRVSGSGPLTGVAAYQDSAAGSLAVVPSQSSGSTRFLFGHIASLSPWYTGIALLNNTTTAANVEVYAIDGNGQLVGSLASFTLAANTRRTAVLSEFVPQVLQRAGDGGWVFLRTTNNVPLLGFELFGHSVFPILANVQGFSLPSTSAFTPPTSGSTPGGSVSIDQLRFTDGTTNKVQFKPSDIIVYVATITNTSGASGSAQLTFTVMDPRSQMLFTAPVSLSLPTSTSDINFLSTIPSNALNGTYTVSASLGYQGQTITKTATFDVIEGSTTPTAGQDSPISLGISGLPQRAFRPGESLRFLLPMANFTGQSVQATINYQFTGPGAASGGSGTLTFTMPPGLSAQTVDTLQIPNGASQGLFVLSSALSAGGSTSTKGTAVTVVPKNVAEAIAVENVYVSDTNGAPKGGFAPGSDILLNIWRLSTFPTSAASTVRYTVTGPNSASILDQPLSVNVGTGGTLGSIPLTLSSDAATGDYTFQGTITYQDNSLSTKTSTLETTFAVSNSLTTLKENLTALHPNVRDINLITRTAFSPGESIIFVRAIYSAFPAPITGTVRYLVIGPPGTVFDTTVNTTFNPGMNVSLIAVSTPTAIPLGPYTLTTTSTGQTLSSSSSSTFDITGPSAPNVNFLVPLTDEKMILPLGKLTEIPMSIHEISVDDGSESIKNSVLGNH